MEPTRKVSLQHTVTPPPQSQVPVFPRQMPTTLKSVDVDNPDAFDHTGKPIQNSGESLRNVAKRVNNTVIAS